MGEKERQHRVVPDANPLPKQVSNIPFALTVHKDNKTCATAAGQEIRHRDVA